MIKKQGHLWKRGIALLCMLSLLSGTASSGGYVMAAEKTAVNTETQTDENADTGGKTGTEAGIEAGEKTGEGAGTEAGEKTGEGAGTEAGAGTGAGTGTEAGEKTGTGTEAGTEIKTGTEEKGDAKTETETEDTKKDTEEAEDTAQDSKPETEKDADADTAEEDNEALEEQLLEEEEILEEEIELQAGNRDDIDSYAPEGYENAAYGKSVTASSSYEMKNEGWSVDFLTDGVLADRSKPSYGWTTNPYDQVTDPTVPAWAVIDLEKIYEIRRINIFPRADQTYGESFPVDFQVKVSEDKKSWTEVYQVKGMKTPKEPVTIDLDEPVNGRYVQLYVSGRTGADSEGSQAGSDGKLVQIAEMAVWGTFDSNYIELSKTSLRLTPGQSEKVEAEVLIDGEEKTPEWSTDDPQVAEVDENGVITAIAAGTTLIHAGIAENNLDKTVKVEVVSEKFSYDDNILLSVFWPPTLEYMDGGDGSTDRWEEQYQLLEDAGINLINNVTGNDLNAKETNLKMLEYADKHGMVVSVADNRFGGNLLGMSSEEIAGLIEEYRNIPGLGGYYILDEPSNPNKYIDVYKAMKDADPEMYMHLNFLPMPLATKNQMSDYLRLSEGIGYPQDYLMYDLYPYPYNSTAMNREGFYNNMRCVWEVGKESGVKTATYLQSVCIPGAYRCPSTAEIRYEAMMALAYGYKQLSYFTWFTPSNRSEPFEDGIILLDGTPNAKIYDGVCELNQEIHALGSVLIDLEAEEVYLNGTTWGQESIPSDFFMQPVDGTDYTVSFLRNPEDGRNYLMVVNNSYDSAQKVVLKPDNKIKAFEMVSRADGSLSRKELNAQGNLELDLEAGDGILLALPKELDFYQEKSGEQISGENLALDAYVTADSSMGENGWYIANLTDGIKKSEDSSQGWSAVKGTDSGVLTMDLGQTRHFNRIDLYAAGSLINYGDGMPKDFEILVSKDGRKYEHAASVNGFGAEGESEAVSFEEQEARYIRLVINAANGDTLRLAELEVYLDDGTVPMPDDQLTDDTEIVDYTPGMNLALNRTVHASSVLEAAIWGWSAKYLNDGKAETGNGWTSNTGIHPIGQPAEEWCMIDLGDQFHLDKVRIYPVGTFPIDYVVEVSENGRNNWKVIADVKGDAGADDRWREFEVPENLSGRYVRMTGTNMTYHHPQDGYTMQVSELEVYGTPIVDTAEAEILLEEAEKLKDEVTIDTAALETLIDSLKAAIESENTTQRRLEDWCRKTESEMEAVRKAQEEYDKKQEEAEKPDDGGQPDNSGNTGASDGSNKSESGSGSGSKKKGSSKNPASSAGSQPETDIPEITAETPQPQQPVQTQRQTGTAVSTERGQQAAIAERNDAESAGEEMIEKEADIAVEEDAQLEKVEADEEVPLGNIADTGAASGDAVSSGSGSWAVTAAIAVLALIAAGIWFFLAAKRKAGEEE